MKTRPEIIKTKRLALRALDDPDKEALICMARDERIKATYMMPELESRALQDAFFERLREVSRSESAFAYGVFFNGGLIGFLNECGKEDGAVELGYFIDPAQWGKGFAAEALGAAIRELFAMGFEVIQTGYFAGNEASRRVMEKCGMRATDKTSKIVYRGAEHDCYYYEIRRDGTAPEKDEKIGEEKR